MLVLRRKPREKIIIELPEVLPANRRIEIAVVDIQGDKVRLGCTADPTVTIHRQEVQTAIERDAARLATILDGP